MTNQDSALILIVDDDNVTRIYLRELLEYAGYRVLEACNGCEALAAYACSHPSMILLDAVMPILDVFTCGAQLQTFTDIQDIPILMMIDAYELASVERAFAVGAMDFITKPIHWAVLSHRIRYLLTASRAMQQLRQQTAQAQLRETQMKMAFEAAQMGIWEWDIMTDKVTWSESKETLFGLEKGSFNGKYEIFLNCVHPQDRDFVNNSIMQAVQEGADYDVEFRILQPDGSIRWLVSKGVVFRDSSGVALCMSGVDMDITKRKQAEEQLRQSELRSQLFADVTLKIRQSLQIDEILQTSVTEVQKLLYADRVLVLRLRSNGTLITVKEVVVPGLLEAAGLQINEPAFGDICLQQYRQGEISAIGNLDQEQAKIPPLHLELLRKFGVQANLCVPIFRQNQLWGLLIAHQCTHPRQWDQWEIELLQQLADQIGIALAQGKILEIETRQREELSRSNEELQQFAFIASHDLQEPLRKIKTFSERLIITCGDSLSEPAYDYLERMQKAVVRMQTLIESLLTLSRVTTKAQPFVSVNLTQITQEVLSDLEVRIQQTGATIEVGDLPIIKADPLQMRQLMQNLIGNALKFHRPQVLPIVKIYSQYLNTQSEQLAMNCELYQIIVEDNGIGFEQKYSDRIFNIFQRLHSHKEYEGTGIGLTICRKIAERHYGRITAQSTPGQGTKFMVILPINSPT